MPPSISSSRLVVEQCTCLKTSLANDRCILHHSTIGHSDQDTLRTTSQAFLECLDRHDHHGRLYSTCKEIISTCLAAILTNNYQSEVAMWDEGPWKYGNIGLREISVVESETPDTLDEAIHLPSTDFSLMSQPSAPQDICCQLRGQGYGLLLQESVGVTSTPAEGTDPPLDLHVRLDFLLFGTQHDACSEGQTLYGSSTNQHQELHVPVAPGELSYEFTDGGQDKVKCTWPRCSRLIRKDNVKGHSRASIRRENMNLHVVVEVKVKVPLDVVKVPLDVAKVQKNHLVAAENLPAAEVLQDLV